MGILDQLDDIPIDEDSEESGGFFAWLRRFLWGEEEDIDLCPGCASEYGSPNGFCPVCLKFDIRSEDEIADIEGY